MLIKMKIITPSLPQKWEKFINKKISHQKRGTIYQPLRTGRIWHKVNFF